MDVDLDVFRFFTLVAQTVFGELGRHGRVWDCEIEGGIPLLGDVGVRGEEAGEGFAGFNTIDGGIEGGCSGAGNEDVDVAVALFPGSLEGAFGMVVVAEEEIARLGEDEEVDVGWHSRGGEGELAECVAAHGCDGEVS